MSETATEQVDPWQEAVARGHEPDRVRFRTLAWLVTGFIGFAVVSHVALWFLLVRLTDAPRAVDRPRSVARSDASPAAGAPPLQPIPGHDEAPWQDVAAMRAAEDRVFGQMGWKVERGRARIPDGVIRAVATVSGTRPSTRPGPGGGR
jgi:hypothetical protein